MSKQLEEQIFRQATALSEELRALADRLDQAVRSKQLWRFADMRVVLRSWSVETIAGAVMMLERVHAAKKGVKRS